MFFLLQKKRIIPSYIRAFILRHFSLLDLRTSIAKINNGVSIAERSSNYQSPYSYRIGITNEFWDKHKDFIAACRELKVSYKIVNITGPNWIENIIESGCDAFVIRPSVVVSIWKEMYDERIKILHKSLGKIIYPTLNEIWIYENKRRMFYWLRANGFPSPKTNIFYHQKDALEFGRKVKLPIIFKSTSGSGGRGVKIITKRPTLIRFIKKYFKSGFLPTMHEKKDKEWGNMLFQEYLPNIREWRIIRIGESYFGYEKLCDNGLHSGSARWKYLRPPDELLNFAKSITEKGKFSSMDLDIFETTDGRLLVNELQTFFGTNYKKEMCVVDKKPGRMLYNRSSNSWEFEAGSFCNNNLCNLRLLDLLKLLDEQKHQNNL